MMKWECEEEEKIGLLFPNWGPCKHSNMLCPEIVRKHREAGLLMGYCSNNASIRKCKMYQFLEMALDEYGLLRESYGSLAMTCADVSGSFKKKIFRFRKDIEILCMEIVGESL